MRKIQSRTYLIFIGSILLFVLAACIRPEGTQPPTAAQTALQQAQQQWQAQELDSYSYTLALSCFCVDDLRQPVVISVTDGEMASIIKVEGGEPAAAEFFADYNTVEKLFALIQKAIDEGADEVTITYDATLGYPTDIKVDTSFQMADEELYLTMSDLQAAE
jgi:Family of unknown function (DUF6174)